MFKLFLTHHIGVNSRLLQTAKRLWSGTKANMSYADSHYLPKKKKHYVNGVFSNAKNQQTDHISLSTRSTRNCACLGLDQHTRQQTYAGSMNAHYIYISFKLDNWRPMCEKPATIVSTCTTHKHDFGLCSGFPF